MSSLAWSLIAPFTFTVRRHRNIKPRLPGRWYGQSILARAEARMLPNESVVPSPLGRRW